MKITDFRIGDKVRKVGSSDAYRVIGLHIGGDVKVAAVDENGNARHYHVSELEVITTEKMNNKIYNLPEWRQCEGCDSIESLLKTPMGTLGYVIDKYSDSVYCLFSINDNGDTVDSRPMGDYPTLDDAKAVAAEQYNRLMMRFVDSIESSCKMYQQMDYTQLTNK